MILLDGMTQGVSSGRRMLVLVFGNGLIGSEVVSQLMRWRLKPRFLGFHWDDRSARERDMRILREQIGELFSQGDSDSQSGNPASIVIVWMAGRGGFASTDEELASETEGFDAVLRIAEGLCETHPHCEHAFHLTSSAGGLFEGQTKVNPTTVPRPLRPYGRHKLAQEIRLRDLPLPIAKFYYRPSSVYGFPGQGRRAGLISTLLLNGLQRRETHFFGRMDTLRDYVSSADVARFVADRVFGGGTTGGTFTLATARPTSLFQLKTLAERIIDRHICASFASALDNSEDIGFLPSSLPADWRFRDVETGMRQIHRRLLTR